MSKESLKSVAAEIKRSLSFPELFQELFPEKYRSLGNSHCPFHADSNPSFQVKKDHGFCHAGCLPSGNGRSWDVISLWQSRYQCDFKAAIEQLAKRCGLHNGKVKRSGKISNTYPYYDKSGVLLYEVCREDPKGKFPQRRPDGKGGWIWSLGDTHRVLYRLQEVLEASTIWIVEGEKDVENLAILGLCATTAPGGAGKGKWDKLVRKHAIHEPLRNKTIIILPDNDEKGLAFGSEMARSLINFSKSVKIVHLPGLRHKEDVSDFIEEHGHTEAKQMLLELAMNTAEFESSVDEGEKDKDETSTGSKFSRLLRLFSESGTSIFLDQHKQGWAELRVKDHIENVRLDSTDFCRHMLKIYVDRFGESISKDTITQVTEYLCSSTGDTRELHNRFAWHNGSLHIDTGRTSWEVIQVTSQGWEIVRPEHSLFMRYPHQNAFPEPEPHGQVSELLRFLPIRNSDSQILIQIWLVAACLGHIPRPGILLYGTQGGGKTTVAEMLRGLLDPSSLPTSSLSKDHAEFVQFMDHHAIICLDNLNGFPQWASDDLCRAVTKGGFSKRRLYTDAEDVIFNFCRTFILTGINLPATSPDLLDRSILIELDRIEESERLPEELLWEKFKEARPRIFGALLRVLSKAMTLRPAVKQEKLPRMADWTIWGIAIAEALGIGQRRFLEAYRNSINMQNDEIVDWHPVCTALIEFMADRNEWASKPTELYMELTKTAEKCGLARSSSWPKAPNKLSEKLKELKHNLLQAGFRISHDRANTFKRTRIIIISKTGTFPGEPSESSMRPKVAENAVRPLDDHRGVCATCKGIVQNNCSESGKLDGSDSSDDGIRIQNDSRPESFSMNMR